MEIIKIKTAEEVKAAYEKMGVKESRIEGLNDKFQTIPENFKPIGLIAVDVKVGKNLNKNIPAFAIDAKGTKYILVGQFLSQYTDKTTASKITKEGANKDKYLVVNNKRVHPCTEGMSEAEVVAFAIGKEFVSAPAKDFLCYQPKYVDNKPIFAETEEEALKDVHPKSYRVISVK